MSNWVMGTAAKVISLAMVGAAPSVALAQDFYAGKTITIIAGTGAAMISTLAVKKIQIAGDFFGAWAAGVNFDGRLFRLMRRGNFGSGEGLLKYYCALAGLCAKVARIFLSIGGVIR